VARDIGLMAPVQNGSSSATLGPLSLHALASSPPVMGS